MLQIYLGLCQSASPLRMIVSLVAGDGKGELNASEEDVNTSFYCQYGGAPVRWGTSVRRGGWLPYISCPIVAGLVTLFN